MHGARYMVAALEGAVGPVLTPVSIGGAVLAASCRYLAWSGCIPVK
jgi:hypothetical protein